MPAFGVHRQTEVTSLSPPSVSSEIELPQADEVLGMYQPLELNSPAQAVTPRKRSPELAT